MGQITQFPGAADFLTKGLLAGAKMASIGSELRTRRIHNQLLAKKLEHADEDFRLDQALQESNISNLSSSAALRDLQRDILLADRGLVRDAKEADLAAARAKAKGQEQANIQAIKIDPLKVKEAQARIDAANARRDEARFGLDQARLLAPGKITSQQLEISEAVEANFETISGRQRDDTPTWQETFEFLEANIEGINQGRDAAGKVTVGDATFQALTTQAYNQQLETVEELNRTREESADLHRKTQFVADRLALDEQKEESRRVNEFFDSQLDIVKSVETRRHHGATELAAQLSGDETKRHHGVNETILRDRLNIDSARIRLDERRARFMEELLIARQDTADPAQRAIFKLTGDRIRGLDKAYFELLEVFVNFDPDESEYIAAFEQATQNRIAVDRLEQSLRDMIGKNRVGSAPTQLKPTLEYTPEELAAMPVISTDADFDALGPGLYRNTHDNIVRRK